MLTNQLRPAIVLTFLLCLITGLVYPGVVTAIAQLVFPHQANGSLIRDAKGQPIGSALIQSRSVRPSSGQGTDSVRTVPSGRVMVSTPSP